MELCSPCVDLGSSQGDRAISLMLHVVLICVCYISSMAPPEGIGLVAASGSQTVLLAGAVGALDDV